MCVCVCVCVCVCATLAASDAACATIEALGSVHRIFTKAQKRTRKGRLTSLHQLRAPWRGAHGHGRGGGARAARAEREPRARRGSAAAAASPAPHLRQTITS